MTNRREFFKAAALGGAALAIPQIVASAMPYTLAGSIALHKDDVILFQGDSITDAGRTRDEKQANIPGAVGSGYAMLTAAYILNKYADKNLSIYNRGISGNKVYQLKERWQTDCLDLKPNLLSIHIGVNDYWHTVRHNYQGTVETYEQDYRALLKQTLEALPNVKLVICEPFGVVGVQAVTEEWFPVFDGYRAVAKKIAGEFNAVFIPFQSIFTKAQKFTPGSYWTADGVHPTLAGAALMSEAWLQAIK